ELDHDRVRTTDHAESAIIDAAMSLDDLQEQLRRALDEQFAALKTHHENAIAEARRQAGTEAEQEMQAKLAAARAEWEEQLNGQPASVREEVGRAAADAQAKLRTELDKEREQEVASARQSAKTEFESERKRAQQDLDAERERAKAQVAEANAAVE